MPQPHPTRPPLAWLFSVLAWLLALIATPIVLWTIGDAPFSQLAVLGVLAQSVASLLALSTGWPRAKMLRTAGVVMVAAWVAEAIGQRTGFPFGDYHYTPALQPQLDGVPLVIPLAWLMMLIPAWAVTEAILVERRARLGRAYPWVFAALAGAVFTAWDLYLDPQMVARGLWVWHQPGAYFGIPLINYFGWWLTAALITCLVGPADLPRFLLFVIYGLTWLFQAVGLGIFWGQPGPALAGFVGMGLFTVWAWMKEGKQWQSSFGAWWGFSAARSRSR
ncbi:MAG: carotenoid biosynthesis protein [Chloroflexota bacterium]